MGKNLAALANLSRVDLGCLSQFWNIFWDSDPQTIEKLSSYFQNS